LNPVRGSMWKMRDLAGEVIDVTAVMNTIRGEEIAEWIRIKDFQTTSKDNWIGLEMRYYTTKELFEQFKKK